ncbi:MAG: hypothetical protein H6570_09505 [Lewinellaceae bacterium]|nr:hypothetical protein [Lewinellaceae bacterium]
MDRKGIAGHPITGIDEVNPSWQAGQALLEAWMKEIKNNFASDGQKRYSRTPHHRDRRSQSIAAGRPSYA